MSVSTSIGIFWIINNKLIGKKIKLSKIEQVDGFKDSGLSHFFEWERMGFDIDEYDKFPRGRIVYDVYNNEFLIYTAKEVIKNEKYKRLILDYFQISTNYKFIYDEHYFLKVNYKNKLSEI